MLLMGKALRMGPIADRLGLEIGMMGRIFVIGMEGCAGLGLLSLRWSVLVFLEFVLQKIVICGWICLRFLLVEDLNMK